MICVIAPYSPVGSSVPHLGAARKLEEVVAALSTLDSDILLVNSAHDECVRAPSRLIRAKCGATDVEMFYPSTYRYRALGKLLNLFELRAVQEAICRRGRPKLVWIYNAYSFECLLARRLSDKFNAPVVLELEDAIFSRGRGLNPKPFLDYAAYMLVRSRFRAAFCVNGALSDSLATLEIPTYELPGIVSREVNYGLRTWRRPFAGGEDRVATVGYFGALTEEKGGRLLLAVIKERRPGIKFIVCGAGAMYEEFRLAATDNLELHTNLPYESLLACMSRCDVIFNPHLVSERYLKGLFPSKVLEAVGSGRVVISTPLPPIKNSDVLSEILFIDGTVEDFFMKFELAKQRSLDYSLPNGRAAVIANESFGFDVLAENVSRHLRG